MKKKDFLELIEKHKDIFKCLILSDASVTNVSNHSSIEVCWYNQNNQRTPIKLMRGLITDLKCIEELNKYKKWYKQTINTK